MMKKVVAREVTHTSNYSNSNSCSLCKKAAAYAIAAACATAQHTRINPMGWGAKLRKEKSSFFYSSKSYTSCFSEKILILPYSQTDIHIVRKFLMMLTYMYTGYLYGVPAVFVLDDFFVNTVPNCSLLLFLSFLSPQKFCDRTVTFGSFSSLVFKTVTFQFFFTYIINRLGFQCSIKLEFLNPSP